MALTKRIRAGRKQGPPGLFFFLPLSRSLSLSTTAYNMWAVEGATEYAGVWIETIGDKRGGRGERGAAQGGKVLRFRFCCPPAVRYVRSYSYEPHTDTA